MLLDHFSGPRRRQRAAARTKSSRASRRAGSARPPKSPPSSPSSPPTMRATSPARTTPSMAAVRLPMDNGEDLAMPVVLDADAAAVFDAFKAANRPPYETLTRAGSARATILQARFATNPDAPELASVTPLDIPAPHGKFPARIYTPKKLRQSNGLSPALVFIHGGGFVIGDLESHDVALPQARHRGRVDRDLRRLSPRPRAQIPRGRRRPSPPEWVAANAKQLDRRRKNLRRRRQRRRQSRPPSWHRRARPAGRSLQARC